ncbi:MAG: KOW motif-containing protein, partial [Acidobacteriaceae bacterium]|nr:KOW motif-containing protein [Acidobacteriaceae bacterium]
KGDRVKVTSGPFFDFTGLIDEIQPEKEKVRALISIFGRETPVELEFYQIEKV